MKKLLIINAVIWAAVILSASYLVKNNENYESLFGVLIVGAGLQNAILYNFLKKEKKTI